MQQSSTTASSPGAPPPGAVPPGPPPPAPLYRLEADVRDCHVEGKIPADLNGAFYRVGPDAQYPLHPRNIPFDGEGHVSMFRIRNGRVDYRSRYVRNERYLAQDRAGRILFPIYRNPYQDDPSVKSLSRSTANTHIINYGNMLLALKEDSPPAALDLLTLETVVPTYTFDGKLPSKTFTAHPKRDPLSGNLVAFGYEAEGFGSKVVSMFEITPQGKVIWNAKIQVPYVGMLHDFAVTQKHIAFYVIPLAFDEAQIQGGGIHWSWDASRPTYLGFMRRGGDGRDIRWLEGPTRSATHVLGAFDDGEKLIVEIQSLSVHANARRLALGSDRRFKPHYAAHRRSGGASADGLWHGADVSPRRWPAPAGRSLPYDAVPDWLPAMSRPVGAGPTHGRRLLRAL
jgi:carotenoid cleavage dioxygenase